MKYWTPKQLQDLNDNYITMSMRQLIPLLGKTHHAISHKAGELGLEKQRTIKHTQTTVSLSADDKEWIKQFNNYSGVLRLAIDCLKNTDDAFYHNSLKNLRK